jgi:hypothetical protein
MGYNFGRARITRSDVPIGRLMKGVERLMAGIVGG